MRASLPDGASVELARPPDWDDAVVAWSAERARVIAGATVAAKVAPQVVGFGGRSLRSRKHRDGWAFWDARTGGFERWGDREWSELLPLATGEVLACRYFEHRIQRLAWPSLDVIADLRFALPQCGIEELVVSPSGRLALAYLDSGQGENGYELFELDPLRALAGAPGFTLPVMWSPPAFTPNEHHVIAVFGASPHDHYNNAWWLSPGKHEDYDADDPSPGGVHAFATILVQHLATRGITRHQLAVDLARGWLPPDPDDLGWSIPSIISIANDSLVLGVPSGARIHLDLPLPALSIVDGDRLGSR